MRRRMRAYWYAVYTRFVMRCKVRRESRDKGIRASIAPCECAELGLYSIHFMRVPLSDLQPPADIETKI